ncbi:MAG TPA: DUF3179 domain-containing (seleno)protein [Chitinophagaceae bacterium]|nr:DUF3179 domain-containing (seleno)protein [Chitinophagaceae bacterium]
MFYQLRHKVLLTINANKVDTQNLIIGISLNGHAKAYPIQIIGYHHQVIDTIGGVPIMVTYCTVCRSGRIFSPLINGHPGNFRLVGMDHFNAMFEDSATKSWWQQETGVAIAGPLKGYSLKELHSRQMRLGSWLREYPHSLILQPDTDFKSEYADLKGYDQGIIKGSLEKKDSSSWNRKSWVIGLIGKNQSKTYDWNTLVHDRVINDRVGNEPVVLYLEKDGISFHAWQSRVRQLDLIFTVDTVTGNMIDTNTHSVWNPDGYCSRGSLSGFTLVPVRAYQEFWHSWKYFHPEARVYQ